MLDPSSASSGVPQGNNSSNSDDGQNSSGSDDDDQKGSRNSTRIPKIVGIVLGVVAFMFLVAALLIYRLYRRRRRQAQQSKDLELAKTDDQERQAALDDEQGPGHSRASTWRRISPFLLIPSSVHPTQRDRKESRNPVPDRDPPESIERVVTPMYTPGDAPAYIAQGQDMKIERSSPNEEETGSIDMPPPSYASISGLQALFLYVSVVAREDSEVSEFEGTSGKTTRARSDQPKFHVLFDPGMRSHDANVNIYSNTPGTVDQHKFLVRFVSGIRTESDILKAILLGADGVLIGGPYLYASILAGQAGVEQFIKQLLVDLDVTGEIPWMGSGGRGWKMRMF
ncbi:hypothetical protein D9758_013754 [Tetrapyrgos nigripes]|uniref:FMN-dependent dehydrogenase domain-containing protein n=1 Tax=Tetrapyrgos nigripes TaxID=182062 RepID=A0A8H5G1Q2_9AGAR|nr:hypothetical protein D9758_013754 [Tetrapyrgos nigripes]